MGLTPAKEDTIWLVDSGSDRCWFRILSRYSLSASVQTIGSAKSCVCSVVPRSARSRSRGITKTILRSPGACSTSAFFSDRLTIKCEPRTWSMVNLELIPDSSSSVAAHGPAALMTQSNSTVLPEISMRPSVYMRWIGVFSMMLTPLRFASSIRS